MAEANKTTLNNNYYFGANDGIFEPTAAIVFELQICNLVPEGIIITRRKHGFITKFRYRAAAQTHLCNNPPRTAAPL